MIAPGLCCINTALQSFKPPVKCRVLQRKGYDRERAIELGRQNIRDLMPMLKYNALHKIPSFRMSSELLPRFTDLEVENYPIDLFDDLFKEVGEYAQSTNQRLTFHPGQFTVLSTFDTRVLNASVAELTYHSECLHRMGVPPRLGVVNIHGGGIYGKPKDEVKLNWAKNYNSLPDVVKGYLTIENDERCYSLQDCLDIARLCGVAVVYDTHHEECYRMTHPEEAESMRPISEMIDDVIATWGDRVPLAHISNQKAGARVGAHSDLIDRIPEELMLYARKVAEREPGSALYVDIEAKGKEEAILAMRKKFGSIIVGHDILESDISFMDEFVAVLPSPVKSPSRPAAAGAAVKRSRRKAVKRSPSVSSTTTCESDVTTASSGACCGGDTESSADEMLSPKKRAPARSARRPAAGRGRGRGRGVVGESSVGGVESAPSQPSAVKPRGGRGRGRKAIPEVAVPLAADVQPAVPSPVAVRKGRDSGESTDVKAGRVSSAALPSEHVPPAVKRSRAVAA